MRKKLLELFFFLCGFQMGAIDGNKKGKMLILIDGLSHDALRLAMKRGYCPTLKKMTLKGYPLNAYYCGLPAATTATEALLFYGTNFNISGFTWFDRKLQKFVRGNRSLELSAFEDSYEKKRNLLHEGSAIMSVFTGGATELSVSGRNLTLSKSIYFIKTAHYFFITLLYPIQLLRTLYLTVKTILMYKKSNHRFVRETFEKITLGQFSCFLTEVEMMRNTKKIFVDFLLYDEFAHIYGPTHPTTFSSLRLIDRYIKRIVKSAQKMERGYEVTILSDHGQTDSIPVDHTHQISIEHIQKSLNCKEYSIVKTYGVNHIDYAEKKLYVVPAGSTLQLYFSEFLKKGTTEGEIRERFPGFIEALLKWEEFGWVLVRQTDKSACLYGKSGKIILKMGDTPIITGNPFPDLSPEEMNRTITSFSYYSTFPNNGDLVLFGSVAKQGKVYSFENHKGTHGGFYGPMVHPFIMSSSAPSSKESSMSSLFDTIAVEA